MQEDREGYMANRYPRPEGPFFDWVLPVYRAVELLKFVQGIAERFSDQNAAFRVQLRYQGTQGRKLEQYSLSYHLSTGQHCEVDMIETVLDGSIFEIENNLEEMVFRLLSPVFEQFEFAELPLALVNNITREVLGNQR